MTDLCRKAGVCRAAEETIELLDLSALPLPADPRLFAHVPLPIAVEQKKPIVRPKFDVEPLHTRAGALEDRHILWHVRRVRVRKITQNREVDARIHVAEREDLEMFDQHVDTSDAGQHRRDDHHRARVVWNAFRKIEARQPFRRDQTTGGLLDAKNGEVARREQHEQSNRKPDRRRGARVPRVDRGATDQHTRHDRNRSEIEA